MSWIGLTHKVFEPLYPDEWNRVVDALDILYGYIAEYEKKVTVAEVVIRAINKGGAEVKVTEVEPTLKQEVTPDTDFKYLLYVEGIHVVVNNPSGSGVDVYFQVRALLDDESEVNLTDWITVGEGSKFDDWLRWIYDAIPSGRIIKTIRIYVYCSSTPSSGYEPVVQIERVTGLQM